MAEDGCGRRVGEADHAGCVDHDHRVRCRIDYEPQFFFCELPLGDANAGADVTEERTIGGKAWYSIIKNPAIFTVISSQAILHRERLPNVKGVSVDFETVVQVVRMNTFSPTFAQFLLHCSSGKIEPAFVEEGAKFVWARHPDEHGRGVGYRAKTRFTLTQLFLRYFALGDVARHPAREGRFATFVQLDAAITRHPANASVRPRDAIFVLILAATALEHLLHKLLRTFAILGVHDLEHSVKAHWFRFREAEQPSPLLRYQKFVIPDVPKPQTEVRRVGRDAHARFAFPQRPVSPSAFRHAGGKRHRRNGEHGRPGLQSKQPLVFR